MHKILTRPWLYLIIFVTALYYKFFLFQQIPFPGDLLIGSYFPWLDYYKMPVKNPLISDVFSQFILWKYLAIESIRILEWPLWNPYSFTGNPLLATYHSAALYPLNLLLLLPKYFGWGFFIYSQTLIASLSFYLFISQFVKSKIARFCGAIIYCLGGLMTTWLELGTAVHAMAWLPLSLYSIHKVIEKNNFRFILLLIISLVLIILSGNVQLTTYSFIVTFSYFLWLTKKDKLLSGKILLLVMAFVFSVLLTAVQILPSYELLQNSIRQTESYSAEDNFGLLSKRDLFKFFIADYFGNTVTRNYWGNLNYSETSAFLGTLCLPLLIYFLFRVRSKQLTFFMFFLFFSLTLAFDNPISHSIYENKIPLLTSSYASRILFITLLSCSVMITSAIDYLIKNKDYSFFFKTLLWSWAAILGIIFGTILAKFLIWNISAMAPSDEIYLRAYAESNDYTLSNFDIAVKNSLVPFGILTIFICFSFAMTRFKRLSILPILLIFFLVLDLGRYFLKFNPFVPSDLIFPKAPALEFLQKQPGFFRVGREHAEILPPNTWTAYNLYSYEGYDPIYLNHYGEFIHFLNGGDIRTGNSSRYAEVSSNYSSPYLDAANAKFFVAIFRDPYGRIPGNLLHYKVKETGYKLIFEDKSTAILENPNAKDRVYFAKKIVSGDVRKLKDIIMTDENFDPRESVTLSENLDISSVTGEGKAQITHYSPNKVRISTETSSDEILILADQYDKGWKAMIDNKEVKISPANLIFRGIKVPQGKHEVLFYYWPKSFETGLKISLVTIFLTALISLAAIKIRRF